MMNRETLSPLHSLLFTWRWPLPLTLSCTVLAIGYAVWFRPRLARAAWFFSGLILLFLTLASPLDALAREYLLAADSLVRIIVWLVSPFLMLEGIPPSEGNTPEAARSFMAYFGWIAGMLLGPIWYVPAIYDATLAMAPLRWIQWAILLACGILFWWPLTAPSRSWRVKPVPAGIWYLFGATMWCSLLGLALAFTRPGLYRSYNRPGDSMQIADFLRNQMEMTRAGDQETAGLLFWIGASAVLLCGVMLMFYRWYVSREMREEFSSNSDAAIKK